MNLIDREVTDILSKPYFKYKRWWLDIECIDEGGKGKATLMFDTEQEALNVTIGFIFQS